MDSIKRYAALVTIVFLISLVSGYLYAVLNPYESARVMQELSDELGWITDLDPALISFVIFLNNAFKSFLAIVLGPLYVAAAILPHGIIELPMVLLSAALGTRLGVMVLSRIVRRTSTEEILSELKWSASFYFRWILPLLFVAAVIETFITPAVLWIIG
jgi:stage II sporulation protein M